MGWYKKNRFQVRQNHRWWTGLSSHSFCLLSLNSLFSGVHKSLVLIGPLPKTTLLQDQNPTFSPRTGMECWICEDSVPCSIKIVGFCSWRILYRYCFLLLRGAPFSGGPLLRFQSEGSFLWIQTHERLSSWTKNLSIVGIGGIGIWTTGHLELR